MANLRAALTRIYQDAGELTPEAVVEDARPEGSELHDRFEWDDSVAGEAYRRSQAAELIRSVRIQYAVDPQTSERKYVRAFQSRHQAGDTKRGYVPTEEIVQDEFATKVLLRQMERDIADLKRKYGHLAEFADMMRGVAETA